MLGSNSIGENPRRHQIKMISNILLIYDIKVVDAYLWLCSASLRPLVGGRDDNDGLPVLTTTAFLELYGSRAAKDGATVFDCSRRATA